MERRTEWALERKHSLGLNCCQAVLLAFSAEILEHWGVKEGESADTAQKALVALGSGFGSGMGCGEATCGALVGAGMVAGLLNSGEEKQRVPAVLLTRDICKKFKERAGALRCADIKGIQTDPVTGKITHGKILCSCDDCVRHAINLCEERCFGEG